MLGPNVIPFQASMTYDLPTYKELDKGGGFYSVRVMGAKILIVSVFAFYIYLYGFRSPNSAQLSTFLLLFLAIYWGLNLIQFLLFRKGGAGYRRMLSNHNGTPLYEELTFLEDHIQLFVPHTNATHTIQYQRIRKVFETETLIVIILEHNQGLPFKKDSLTGGPLNTFLTALFEKCPHIKRKKLTSLLPGKIVHGVLIAVSVFCLLLGIWLSQPVQKLRESSRIINNSMSYTEIANELEAFGIHDIPQSVIDDLESYDEEYDYVYTYQMSKCLDLLSWAGMGDYNYITWKWTPSECGVYWFDAEVMSLNTMYTDFLRGVRALDPQALNFTDIEENTDGVNLELGTGIQTVSFTWNAQRYTLEANVLYDWFDLNVAVQLNEILEDSGKQLYFAWDQAQGYIVLYGDKAWAKSFERATGIDLNTDPTKLDALF